MEKNRERFVEVLRKSGLPDASEDPTNIMIRLVAKFSEHLGRLGLLDCCCFLNFPGWFGGSGVVPLAL